MSLEDYTKTLDFNQQFELFLVLSQHIIPEWDKFSTEKSNLWYSDSVVGLTHHIRPEIVNDILDLIVQRLQFPKLLDKIKELRREIAEPIVALQDDDWDIPEHIKLFFYACNSILDRFAGEKLTRFSEDQMYLAINQICDSILTAKIKNYAELNEILSQFRKGKIHLN